MLIGSIHFHNGGEFPDAVTNPSLRLSLTQILHEDYM